jgi:hypothetical protein
MNIYGLMIPSCRCEKCRRASIISYTLHRHLCLHEDGMQESEIMTRHEYYSKMCMSGEMLLQYKHAFL